MSKKRISLSPVTWYSDIPALSHMTDQRHFFEGSLRPTWRTIKVGGENSFSCNMGDIWMITSARMALLKNYLLVPGLVANLMSVQKACAKTRL